MVSYPEPYDFALYHISPQPLTAKMWITAEKHPLANTMTNVTVSLNTENLQSSWWPGLLG